MSAHTRYLRRRRSGLCHPQHCSAPEITCLSVDVRAPANSAKAFVEPEVGDGLIPVRNNRCCGPLYRFQMCAQRRMTRHLDERPGLLLTELQRIAIKAAPRHAQN